MAKEQYQHNYNCIRSSLNVKLGKGSKKITEESVTFSALGGGGGGGGAAVGGHTH